MLRQTHAEQIEALEELAAMEARDYALKEEGCARAEQCIRVFWTGLAFLWLFTE